ncbi:hypothetical protein PoB_002260200 [Plakobranchus ocellatus]|uniref:Uncharacterized protein n=1 Tax=Plakobranchus ocellatus TaxID=259542 RepID=A0AAV3ZNK0_9GAST|nr:hypothetical protein PoB_002260200 [Plakobranchus ocellatus]
MAASTNWCLYIGPTLYTSSVHNKVISGFRVVRHVEAPVAGLGPVTEGSLKISGRIRYPLCHRRPPRETILIAVDQVIRQFNSSSSSPWMQQKNPGRGIQELFKGSDIFINSAVFNADMKKI